MISYIFVVIILISYIILGLLIFLRNPKGRINRLFVIMILWMTIWVISNFLENESIGGNLNKLFLRIDFASAPFIFYSWLIFCLNFPQSYEYFSSRIKRIIIFFPAFIFALLSFTDLIIYNIDFYGKEIHFDLGKLYSLYGLCIISYTLLGGILLFIKYRKLRGILKYQVLYVILGFLIAFLNGIVFNLFLQRVIPSSISRLGIYGSFLVIGLTGYAITKHQLMDIHLIILRTITYSLVVLLISATVVGLTLLLPQALAINNTARILIAITVSIFIVIILDPLKKWIGKATDKIFFKAKINYPQIIQKLSEIINEVVDIDELLDLITKTLTKEIKIKSAILILEDKNSVFKVRAEKHPHTPFLIFNNESPILQYLNKQPNHIAIKESLVRKIYDVKEEKERKILEKSKEEFEIMKAEVIVPIVTKNKIIALLLLGEKLSGDSYSDDDINLIKTISPQIATAIKKSKLYTEVKELSENLQQKVDEQTRDIKEKSHRLEKLLAIRSEFLDIASHQLRTPVSMIRGVLSMIRDGDLQKLSKDQQAQFIENAWQKGAKLDTIINDILAASELDTQKFQVDSQTPIIHMEDVIDQVVKGFTLEAGQRGIELKWQKPKLPLPKVKSQAVFLEQAISNLVGNALKYTPSTKMVKEARSQRGKKGVVEITIGQEKNNVVVSVKDNGIGIPKDEIKKLFDKFARASNATAMYTDGSGLGLFIVKEIIEGHHGKVWVESEENKGSIFYVSLPITSN